MDDLTEARAIQARIDAGEATVPSDVVALIIIDGLTPVAAWRRHRGLTQSDLARRAGLSQLWVNRIAGEGAWHAGNAAQAGGGAGGTREVAGGWGLSIERFPHELTRRGFPLRLRCDSDFLLVAGGQHGWHERFHRIFETGLLQRSIAG
jgi:hypothetical protein